MILTGNEIYKNVKNGKIIIEPFSPEQINPNSYNYRLGDTLLFKKDDGNFEEIKLPEDGYVIEPHRTYLGCTYETLGSSSYSMSLIGRSSLGRLGLFLTVSANLVHIGSVHKWTLEIVSAKPFKLYPFMKIGQISFWCNFGEPNLYIDGYSKYSHPHLSKFEGKYDINRK